MIFHSLLCTKLVCGALVLCRAINLNKTNYSINSLGAKITYLNKIMTESKWKLPAEPIKHDV